MAPSDDKGSNASDAGGPPSIPYGSIQSPAGLEDVLSKIRVDVLDGRVLQVHGYSPSTTAFNDSFNNGGTWRNTFADGGQFLSNFNNLYSGQVSLRHPAVQAALAQLREAITTATTGAKKS